ncbi:MAG: hypothetical protein LBC86_11445 [Oscillospiraceae bacterium]|jgi:hypothetical protein|nr:hypothetical protein [Oscillospiraceae bacterium]
MGNCIKCGRETITQYECYSAELKDLAAKENPDSNTYEHRQDFFCNKCVLGKEWLSSLIISLISLTPVVIGIIMIATDFVTEGMNYLIVFMILFLGVAVLNIMWFISVINSLVTGRIHDNRWSFGLILAFGGAIDAIKPKEGSEEYIKYLKTQTENKDFKTVQSYKALIKAENNRDLDPPATLTIFRDSNKFNAKKPLSINLNDVYDTFVYDGESKQISIKRRYNNIYLGLGYKIFEFEAEEGADGELHINTKRGVLPDTLVWK